MNTDTLQKNRTRLLPALFILLTAVLLMCVVTQSSPLYPLNGWVDSQCFFTVGKSMASGQVLYRDVYEQKGPLLLGLHAAASLVQRDGFLGVWLMQVGAAAVFLAASYKLLRLFGPRWACLGALPFLGAAAYTSVSYVAGDSAEEWCMPLLAVCLYGLVKACMERRPLGPRWAFAAGVLGGCVLWIKYSMLGFFLAWGAAMLVMALRWKGWREALAECGAVLLGAAAATLPWVVYFGVNGALDDWFTAYFYNNLFLYASGAGGPAAVLKKVAQSLWYAMEHNRLQGALLLAGLGCLLPLVRERALRAAAALAGLFFGLALTTYGAGGWLYYFQIFMVFLPLAFVLPVWLCGKVTFRLPKGVLAAGLCLALAAGVAAGWWRTPSRPMLGTRREDTVQYQFSRIVQASDDRSMTVRHMLDGGFYTVCDVTPTQKYIGKFNIPLEEMRSELDRYVTDREVEFVVTRCEAENWKEYKAQDEPFLLENGYVQVADGEGPYLDNGKLLNMRYYLYRRAEHAGA